MKRSTWTLVVVVTLFAASLARAEDATSKSNSSSDQEAITTFGEKIDPDGDSKVVTADGAATITVPGTWHDLTHGDEYFRLNAPRLLDEARGNFSVQVKVDPLVLPKPHDSSGGHFAYVGSGIVVWLNETNFVRFECAGVSIRRYVFVERFENGRSVLQKNEDVPEAATRLRVTRKGDQFKFQRSQDGHAWTNVQVINAQLPKRLRVGVHAINTTNEEFCASLSDYQFKP